MNIVIRIAPEGSEDKRSIFFADEISHHVREKDIQEILKESNRNFWKTDSTKGAELGRQLYRFLNGSAGHIDSLIEESRQKGEPLSIYLDIPYALNSLPVELLNDDEYLVRRDHPKTFIIRSVSDRCSRLEHTPETRPLKVLFIACSPLDLRSQEVLQFEKEEEQILSAVEKFSVEVVTEDLGSLTGLFDKLYEEGPFDVVHITGHAGHDHELGPVFYMEDDIGRLDKVTPDRLWKEALEHFRPRLLFLSGCSTGKGDKVNSAESFAHNMVEKGVPLVLGWGLPVSDVGATAMTQVLYKYLGIGKSVIEAVNNAIKNISDRYHPWPLLRLFTDGSPLTAFITSGQKIRYAPVRKTRYKYLADSHIKVLEKGFVGRRREIQKGVRALKGMPDEQGVSRNGLIVRGPAGVGKSCLAGKLIERFKDLELVVLHGLLKGERDVLAKLRRLFDRKGESDGVAILKSDLTYEDKIKELFRTILRKLPVMLYFDDFEDNLVNRGDYQEIKRAVIPLLRPLLQAINWHEIEARMLITSRYPFKLEHEGENLFNKLVDITLLSFKDADLYKKCAELPNILASKHRKMYLRYGGGNPRLLEWLEIIAKDEDKYDIDSLQQALEGKNEDYIRKYLADILAKTECEAFSEFLQKASVFRQPVDQTAFEGIGTVDSLSKGVDLTLLEKEEVSGHKPVFWVNPVIRESQWAKLSRSEQKQFHQIAMNWYDHEISTSDSPDHEYLQEVVYHALASDNIRIACRHSITLGQYLENLLLYKDKQQVQQTVADRITEHVIEEAISRKDKNISVLLNNLGSAYSDLGNANKAIEYYEKSLEIDLKVFGDRHPNVAGEYNNLGSAYHDLGNANKAIEYYEKSLEIDLKVFGDRHPDVAIRYNNLGGAYSALGDANKAIEYYEKALEIDLKVFGDRHPDVATRYNNLGSAYHALGDANKAIEYYEKSLEIDLKVFGDQHPNVATRYNNLGSAYHALGDANKAIEYYEKSLEIDLKVFGDRHPNVAIDYNNLGSAYHALGDANKAIEYYEKSLEIDLKVFGDRHPNVAIDYNNLGGAYSALGDANKAIEYYEKSLEIDLKVFGDRHPNVAIRYNNLGLAYSDLGDANKAIEYFEKSLEINLKVFGDQHPKVAIRYNNLGSAYRDLGDANKAIEYYEKSLEIDLKVFGDQHPNVARDYNNLGLAYRDLGDANKAIEYYEKSLEIDLKVFGDRHPNVATRYNNLGLAYSDLGDANKAIEYYEKSLEIDLKVFGDRHPNVATRYNNLGSAYHALGDANKAIEYYEKSLEIDLKVFGDQHPNVATRYNNLGSAYHALGDANKAIEYYEKSLEIDLKVFGDRHPNVAIDYNNLGSAYRDLGDANQAIEYYEKSLEIFTTIYGKDHPSTKTVNKNLYSIKELSKMD